MKEQQTAQATRWTRDYVYDILRELGIGYLFGVPGTNEIPIIDGCEAPENKDKIRFIECLHENIALGAAMGYSRLTGKPGVVIVHVTPGIGHCLGNLYNAWKSRMPIVVLCGQQQNELVTQEPLLASNLVQIADQFTKWSHELRAWEEFPLVLQRAFKEAMAPPAGPVFLSLPWDFTLRKLEPDERIQGVTRIHPGFIGAPDAVKQAAQVLGQARDPVIIVGDAVGQGNAWDEVQELAELLGAPVYLEGFSSMANFPNNNYHWQGELPGDQSMIQKLLAPHDVAFLCGFGSQAQLAVFKYSEKSLIPDSVRCVYLANNTWDIGKNRYGEVAILGDIKATLPGLNQLVAQARPATAQQNNTKIWDAARKREQTWREFATSALKAPGIWGVTVADSLRELIAEEKLAKKFVYVHEAVSDATSFQMLLPLGAPEAAPTSYYCVAGGSLGWSMPASLGTQLALEGWQGITPEVVINAVGDGASLFYPQVWWTAAHRKLPILYIIMNNTGYRTLQEGLQQVIKAYGSAEGFNWRPVTETPEYLTIRDPSFSFVELAKAFGLPNGRVVTRPREVKDALKEGIDCVRLHKQSFVLEVRLDPRSPLKPPEEVKEASLLTAQAMSPSMPPPLHFYFRALARERNLLRAETQEESPSQGMQIVF
ncbi:MAG: thiamine pyrophosphate-binding protein [Hyalangium sp.]|uniref:thiamine pyrophosphate-binding protein n=1 Tax=Hyalangium sp. TaxID=2028555 RepID=UPI00389AB31B